MPQSHALLQSYKEVKKNPNSVIKALTQKDIRYLRTNLNRRSKTTDLDSTNKKLDQETALFRKTTKRIETQQSKAVASVASSLGKSVESLSSKHKILKMAVDGLAQFKESAKVSIKSMAQDIKHNLTKIKSVESGLGTLSQSHTSLALQNLVTHNELDSLLRANKSKLDNMAASFYEAISTTDATVTDAASFTPDDGHATLITVFVEGVKSDKSQAAGYLFSGVFRRDGSTTTQVGTTERLVEKEDDAAWHADFTTSDAAIVVQVTGKAATDISWNVYGSAA